MRLKLAQASCSPWSSNWGEVLRTVIVLDWNELVGAIILLRELLTFYVHWKIKVEESRLSKCLFRMNARAQPDRDAPRRFLLS